MAAKDFSWWENTIGPIFEGNGSPFTSSMHRNYVRVYKVLVNSGHVTEQTVCQAPNLPKPFSPKVSPITAQANGQLNAGGLAKAAAAGVIEEERDLDSVMDDDPYALAVEFSASREFKDDYRSWIVTIKYSTQMPEGGPPLEAFWPDDAGGPQNNPDELPYKLFWSVETFEIAPTRDYKGRPYLTTAGQPYSPPRRVALQCPVLTVIHNVMTFRQRDITEWAGAISTATFMGAPAGCAQHMAPEAENHFLGGLSYWRVTRKIRFTPDPTGDDDIDDVEEDGGWGGGGDFGIDSGRWTWHDLLEDVLNTGTIINRMVDGEVIPGDPVPAMPAGVPVTTPILLSDEGHYALIDEETGLPIPTYTRYKEYPHRDLNELFTSDPEPGEVP